MLRFWHRFLKAFEGPRFSPKDEARILAYAQGLHKDDLQPLLVKGKRLLVSSRNPYMAFLKECYTPVPDQLLRALARERLIAHATKPPPSA